MRRAEIIEHGLRAERLEGRAIHEAERGHFGRAMELERRSEIQRAEMMGAALCPRPMMGGAMGGAMMAGAMMGPCMYPAPGVRAAETAMIAGAVGGVIVAEEVAAANRRREAELLMYGAATRPPMVYGGAYPGVYPPAGSTEIYGQPGGVSAYPGAYPGYPPGAAYPGAAYGTAGYPPGGAYPPASYGYPPAGYRPY